MSRERTTRRASKRAARKNRKARATRTGRAHGAAKATKSGAAPGSTPATSPDASPDASPDGKKRVPPKPPGPRKKLPRMRLADAFRAKKRDEHYIVNCYIFAIGSLKSTESKMRESRLKLLLDYLKEAARILEPPRAAAFGGLSADGRPVQMTVVHNIDRPVRPAPPLANSAVRSDSAWPEEPISANAPFAAG